MHEPGWILPKWCEEKHEITPKTRKQFHDTRRSKILRELMKKSQFSSGGIEVSSEEKSEKSPPKKRDGKFHNPNIKKTSLLIYIQNDTF